MNEMHKLHGNFFALPNEIFELGLSSSAFKVYCFLLRCANRKTHQCYPSYNTIGEALDMSVNTVRKSVCELVDIGLIYTENTTVITKDGEKRNGTLRYTILDYRPVLEAHCQKKLRELAQQTAEWNYAKTAMV